MKSLPKLIFSIFIITMFTLLISCSKKDGRYVARYKDGQTLLIADYVNGKLNGEFVTYYNSGGENVVANFINGKIVGKITRRNMMGRIDLELNIDSNFMLDGSFLVRYKNDRIHYTGLFREGKHFGPSLRIYENGSLWEAKFYNNAGQAIDTTIMWYDGGNMMSHTVIGRSISDGIYNYWSEDGFLSLSGFIHNGFYYEGLEKETYTGNLECYYKTGDLALSGQFINGVKTGDWKGWYFTGQKSFEGHIDSNQVTGPWKYWSKDGDLVCEFVYQDSVVIFPMVYQIEEELKKLAKMGEKVNMVSVEQ